MPAKKKLRIPFPTYKNYMVRETPATGEFTFQVKSPTNFVEVVRPYFDGLDREHLCVFLLDTKNNVLGMNVVSIGTLNAALMHPREIFKPAILLSAASIIIAHNHPSGDPQPSAQDRETTLKITDAGKLLGIPLLDHIIMGENFFYSFAQHGEVG